MDWNDFAKDVHQTAVDNGLWDKPRSFDDIVCECLVHLGRTYEEYRSGRPNYYHLCQPSGEKEHPCVEEWGEVCDLALGNPCEYMGHKPHGVAAELGECVLRLLDYLATKDADIDGCFRVCAQVVTAEDMDGSVIKVALDSAECLLTARRINPSSEFDTIRHNGLMAVVIYISLWEESNGIDLESILRELHECEKARAGRRGDGRDG